MVRTLPDGGNLRQRAWFHPPAVRQLAAQWPGAAEPRRFYGRRTGLVSTAHLTPTTSWADWIRRRPAKGLAAEIAGGVAKSAVVIVHPGNDVEEGGRVDPAGP